MAEFDALVLGGGPAGSAAALVAARAGLRVALLERQEFPRHRPGETLHPGVEPLLRRLGVWPSIRAAGYLRHPGVCIRDTRQTRFEAYGADADGPWLGFQADRADFDRRLLAAAAAAGVNVRQPCAATAPLVEAGRACGVATPRSRIAARVTIDASGGRHWLARRLGIRLRRLSPRLMARYGYAHGCCPALDERPTFALDATGWTWTARVAPQTYHWARLNLVSAPTGELVPDDIRGLQPLGPVRRADVTWRIAAAPAGPGYFLAGDAAAVLDPASSRGVLRALMSGMMAGHLAAAAAGGQSPEMELAEYYNHWLTGWVAHDAAELRWLYGAQMPVGAAAATSIDPRFAKAANTTVFREV